MSAFWCNTSEAGISMQYNSKPGLVRRRRRSMDRASTFAKQRHPRLIRSIIYRCFGLSITQVQSLLLETSHCFDYLAQIITCAMDTTIEPAINDPNVFLGSGFPRQCRDFNALKEFLNANRVFNATGMLT